MKFSELYEAQFTNRIKVKMTGSKFGQQNLITLDVNGQEWTAKITPAPETATDSFATNVHPVKAVEFLRKGVDSMSSASRLAIQGFDGKWISTYFAKAGISIVIDEKDHTNRYPEYVKTIREDLYAKLQADPELKKSLKSLKPVLAWTKPGSTKAAKEAEQLLEQIAIEFFKTRDGVKRFNASQKDESTKI